MPPERKYDYPTTEYSRAIARLGWSQIHAAKMFGIDARTSRRYASGDLQLPAVMRLTLRILVNGDFNWNVPAKNPLELLIDLIYDLELTKKRLQNLIVKEI
jgi:hypothetical protein